MTVSVIRISLWYPLLVFVVSFFCKGLFKSNSEGPNCFVSQHSEIICVWFKRLPVYGALKCYASSHISYKLLVKKGCSLQLLLLM